MCEREGDKERETDIKLIGLVNLCTNLYLYMVKERERERKKERERYENNGFG